MRRVFTVFLSCVVLHWIAGTARAQTPEKSLAHCQIDVGQETTKFIELKLNAIGACLKEVTKEIVEKNHSDPAGAADRCVTEFRKLGDTREGQSLEAQLSEAIADSCDPDSSQVLHTLDDLLGTGNPGVPESLNVSSRNAYCARFGGDGTIDTLGEWIDCIVAASECAADSSIAAQYPRALEWMASVRPYMQEQVPPANDPTEISDALAGLDSVFVAIDGTPAGDLNPDIQCPGFAASDVDGDGFSPPQDCNDNVNTIFPGATEVCDYFDNDCDGQVDEGFSGVGEICSVGVGACRRIGVDVCTADGAGVECNATRGEPSLEVCDGIDNDCDGLVDEGFEARGEVCVVGLGACQRIGFYVCPTPQTLVCDVSPGPPSPEVCGDGVDNDCDGQVDEDCSCVDNATRPCTPPGEDPDSGTQTCSGGIWGPCVGSKKADGGTCASADECLSGQCVDGYCCDSSCSNPCDSCNLSGNLGTCTLRPHGSAPDPSCGAYLCDGTSATCPSSCAGDDECATGNYCDSASCVAKKAEGAACSSASECISGTCEASVCGTCDIVHDNGLGGSWTDCVPLGTYDETQATKACGAWTGDPAGCINATCSSLGVVCGEQNNQGACWAYEGVLAGKVSLSTGAATCPVVNDTMWD